MPSLILSGSHTTNSSNTPPSTQSKRIKKRFVIVQKGRNVSHWQGNTFTDTTTSNNTAPSSSKNKLRTHASQVCQEKKNEMHPKGRMPEFQQGQCNKSAASPIGQHAMTNSIHKLACSTTTTTTPSTSHPVISGTALNAEQQTILSNTSSNIFIDASPGTGKTFLLIQKMHQLREEVVRMQNGNSAASTFTTGTLPLVVLTFSKKAKSELRERLDSVASVSSLQIYVHTFHSFFLLILRYRWNFSMQIISDAEIKMIVTKIVKEEYVEEPWSELHDQFIKWKIRRTLGARAGKSGTRNPTISITRERCMHKILAAMEGKHDLTDILLESYKIMQQRPSEIPLIKNLLVDEFQDTSILQMELMKLLKVDRVIAVGDPKQSIFGWRQARGEENIKEFVSHYNAKIFALTQNYRSNHQIIRVANQIIPSQLKSTISCSHTVSTFIKRYSTVDRLRETLMTQVITCLKLGKTCAILCRTNSNLRKLKFTATDLVKHQQFLIGASITTTSSIGSESPSQIFSDVVPTIRSDASPPEEKQVKNSLSFLTLHNSKGKEFDVVFIADTNQGHIPHFFALKCGDTAEEKRLFYVGVTRAKEFLFLYGWDRETTHGRFLEPSQYVYNLIDSKCPFIHVDETMVRGDQWPVEEEGLDSDEGDTFTALVETQIREDLTELTPSTDVNFAVFSHEGESIMCNISSLSNATEPASSAESSTSPSMGFMSARELINQSPGSACAARDNQDIFRPRKKRRLS
mmetsp:Transcript_8296/g.30615  ORF Transcript_8296/g.30615 Transcript_8296/m.30615 type:complete len:746 (-) Transcript_8296:98-2335(-)|eukprot:CAMPEP_0117434908 /NCGR_PEP_ID=MMETSP0759-20121206/196_1 /TAXON_ID=63605 /ORGANISM="Percolomonas cosmopolitus, Strain WS" /LENGTH=745 /DNA_ID=CAMNT_0005226415 /DNA_START=109 /DNA_END=2346 /DNA_ORIENTATION=+